MNGKLHLKECDFVPIDCPNGCGCKQFKRCKLSDHITKCPLQYINCIFEEVGCNTERLLLRGEMTQRHALDNLHQHLLLIAQFNTQVSTENGSLFTSFHSKYNENDKKNSEDICSQEEALKSLKCVIKSLENSL